MSRTMTYAEAVREAMATAMTNDERVFLMGEDVGVYGGAFGVSNDLYERFGTDRVRDTTISELGIVGMGRDHHHTLLAIVGLAKAPQRRLALDPAKTPAQFELARGQGFGGAGQVQITFTALVTFVL